LTNMPVSADRLRQTYIKAAILAGVGLIGLTIALVLMFRQPTQPPPATAEHPFQLLTDTLEQLYLAFGEDSEEAIYDALAQVAGGDVLSELYLQRRSTLVNQDFASETTAIHGVDLIEMTMERDGDTLRFDARWHVLGSVGHEEHEHVRGNTYRARLTLTPVDGKHKVTAFELLDVKRADDADDTTKEANDA